MTTLWPLELREAWQRWAGKADIHQSLQASQILAQIEVGIDDAEVGEGQGARPIVIFSISASAEDEHRRLIFCILRFFRAVESQFR
ncbi:hypothetical protein [Achromobacter anxifer]|uniref:hypothetical protein n=1 Tax=Achromobacter anxifer TaxID=1287737 RepID=UPI001590F1DB|nr:hypothetical protein [Achromobacter anxifer]